MFINTNRKEM